MKPFRVGKASALLLAMLAIGIAPIALSVRAADTSLLAYEKSNLR